MSGFRDFLRDRIETGGFSTEDTLISFLPLLREVIEAHGRDVVAPLEGLGDLQVEGARIWFSEDRCRPPRQRASELRRVELANRAAVEIVSESRRTSDVGDGEEQIVNLQIGGREEPIVRPVFLPGYVSWEHQIGHHDPLTDVFSLGLILASLACNLDLTEPDQLEAYVSNRQNLFALNPGLHPVFARAIVRMTELDRHRRVQDLPALLKNLENYRDQEVDFEFDLARVEGFGRKDVRSKQQVVLNRLQERLFELSRRNRLLHFRPTMQTVNLTHASVPLSFDIRNIRGEQVLIWNEELHKAAVSGRQISLNKYLNFAEALYLPSVLDRILADTRRDMAEFGFAQLRLVVCFLHWANLKEKPIERFESPLVLLPVRLKKKKGIRDTYTLQIVSEEAEVNPVIRHQFKQLYAIDLPETLDLSSTDLGTFFEYLEAQIAASESAVTLEKIDRPRIELIHEKARRKLDQYRRRARIAGRGVRSFLDLDYSYDPANYNPLGIKLFSALIRPPSTRLREIIEESPRPRVFACGEPEPPAVEKQRTLYALREGGDENPYTWSFDLCSVTLANFKYRKMSLVRDYETLLANGQDNDAFDATFSLVPRPVQQELPQVPPLADRHDVVLCDPTQATAIAEARSAKSYIIQGPPGTGKSQTITNLIADYVARGKRVLFVCEKRAAIDVVFARLRQCGLGELCCLIHDSQTDKKEFVMNLKQTYESFLAEGAAKASQKGLSRDTLLERIEEEIGPLEHFDRAMQATPKPAGVPLRRLLGRCVELWDQLPALSAIQRERLPNYAAWCENYDRLERFHGTVREIQPDGILAHHPLRLLSPSLAALDHPLELVGGTIEAALKHLANAEETMGRCGIPRTEWQTLARARALIDYAADVAPLAEIGRMPLLDPKTESAGRFDADVKSLQRQGAAVEATREKTAAWRAKLPEDDAATALEQARTFEQSSFAWLRPSWWRLRRILKRAYDFSTHVVRPSWSQVLSALAEEYAQLGEYRACCGSIARDFGIPGDVEQMIERVARLRSELPQLPGWLVRIHAALLKSDKAGKIASRIVAAGDAVGATINALDKILENYEDVALGELGDDLTSIQQSLDDLPDFLHGLSDLADAPRSLVEALRTLPLSPSQLEAAVADESLRHVYRDDRPLRRFTGPVRRRHVHRLADLCQSWRESNAAAIRRGVCDRFAEHVRISSLPAAKSTAEQKEFKKAYNRGRRELEHEFGKTMRYKSIRDLVAGESGEVVKDLKPVWLMSPLSVSDTLPLDTDHVDVVIFDEASQITLEESIPSIFRAAQAIVVGDEMQLPPTDFFSAKRSEEEEEILVEEGGELVAYDLESNSFLNHAAKNLPSTMLGWHYRSRSESLISFSNWVFYDGKLLTVPEEELPAPDRRPLTARQASDADQRAAEVLVRPISFHFLEHGVYENRRNRAEADYIARLVRQLAATRPRISLGVVAFSEAQQDEINNALSRLGQEDPAFGDALDAEFEREEDGQFVGLLVKNLENIQGDERDVVILSVCYGHDARGKMRMNFGPINKSGGEKRLNVAFSRAKHNMVLVSSIRYTAITNDYNDGANCLKNYLRYADAVSSGNAQAVQRVLHGASRWHDPAQTPDTPAADSLADQIAAAIAEHGYLVDRGVGQSHFRCDLAVRRAEDAAYRLGILVDGDAYYDQEDLLERDLMRPQLLGAFGWNVAHVLAKDWYDDRDGVLERLLRAAEGEDDFDPADDTPPDDD